jgi:poly(A) polymerase
MGKEPKDFDVATNATPAQVKAIFPRTVAVGVHFGVMLVLHGEYKIEVATFRSDDVYEDGRHPRKVTFSTLEEDVKRRDFTINGLAMDPVSNRVFDLVGGEKDIKARIVRTIGEPSARFGEDKLRMIRAVRFAANLDFQIEEQTFGQIRQLAEGVRIVSAERIRDEMSKMLVGEGRGRALRLLRETGLLRVILPEVEALSGVQQPEKFHPEGDVFEHTVLTLEQLRAPSVTLAFAALLHDIGKPATQTIEDRIRFNGHVESGVKIADEICRRLKFSNTDREKITGAIERHMKFMHVKDMRLSRLKGFLAEPNIEEEIELHRADCLASHGMLDNWQFCLEQLRSFKEEELKPPPLVSGDDLIALGFSPGPRFKKILEAVSEKQLEGQLTDKESAVRFIKETFLESQ